MSTDDDSPGEATIALSYYTYAQGQSPTYTFGESLSATTVYPVKKMYFFNNRIAFMSSTQCVVGIKPEDPYDIQVLTLIGSVYRVKVMYDHLFFITTREVRWSNNGIDWKSMYYPSIYTGDPNALTCFAADGKVYVNLGLANGRQTPTTLFCADIMH
jgi:hypothetical protein